MCLMSRSLSQRTSNVQKFMASKQHCSFRDKETLKSMFFTGLTLLQSKCFDNDISACSSHFHSAVNNTIPIATANVNVRSQIYLEHGVTASVDA